MRLFVALEVPEPVRREVRRRIAGLRDRLPRARWVNPEVLHLTLLFLGEVPPDDVPALAGRLRDAFAPFPPLPLRLAGAGTFPAGRPARVAWIGVAAPPELARLQAALAGAVGTAGAAGTAGTAGMAGMAGTAGMADTAGMAEPAGTAGTTGKVTAARAAPERPYHPHVTLARCPSPWPRGAAEKFAAAFPGEIGPPFLAVHGALVESKLSPKGPRYRDLAELPLAGGEPEEAPALAAERDGGAER